MQGYVFWLAISLWPIMMAGLLYTTLRLRQLTGKQHHLHLDCANTQHELRILTSGAVGVGQRLIELESRLRTLTQQLEAIENQEHYQTDYQQATKLVEKGLSVDEISEACHISRAEAELVVALVQLNKQVA